MGSEMCIRDSDILILSTAGAKDPAIYRSLEEVAEDYPNSGTTAKIYRKVSALFEQGKTTLADTLIRKVKIAGIAPPTGQDDGEKAEALITAIETLRQTDDDWYMLRRGRPPQILLRPDRQPLSGRQEPPVRPHLHRHREPR